MTKRWERFPFAAALVTAVFAVLIATQNGSELSVATSLLFWGEAIALAPLMRMTGIANATTSVEFVAMMSILFAAFALVETLGIFVLRKVSPRARWLVRGVGCAVAIGLLLFTPPAPPMRLF